VAYGAGINGQLADALSNDYIQSVSTSYFREGNYDAGIRAALQSTIAIVTSNGTSSNHANDDYDFSLSKSESLAMGQSGALLLVGIAIAASGSYAGYTIIAKRRKKKAIDAWMDQHYVGPSRQEFDARRSSIEKSILNKYKDQRSVSDEFIAKSIITEYTLHQFPEDVKNSPAYRNTVDYHKWMLSKVNTANVHIDEDFDVNACVRNINEQQDAMDQMTNKNIDVLNRVAADHLYDDVRSSLEIKDMAEEASKNGGFLDASKAKRILDTQAADIRFNKDYESFKSSHIDLIGSGFKDNAFKNRLRSCPQYDDYYTGSIADATWIWLFFNEIGADDSSNSTFYYHNHSSDSSSSSSFSDSDFSGGFSDGGGFSGGW
jgi:uncharacterized membrane protein YgcG